MAENQKFDYANKSFINRLVSTLKSKLANVALSGKYSDLSDTPTIPTVNNGKLTIQKNGTNLQTFTSNQSGNVTANITVPTKMSEVTNDMAFSPVVRLTQSAYDSLPDTKLTDGKIYLITDGISVISNGVIYSGGGSQKASDVSYNNTESGLEATNVQSAIDELNTDLGGFSFYPEKLTQAQYDDLPEETKTTQGLIFVIVKE